MNQRSAALLLALFAGALWLAPAAADPKPGKPLSSEEFEQLWKMLQPPNDPMAGMT